MQHTAIDSPMTGTEKRATFALASIFMLRMLGLFMILPVFSLYAGQLSGTTPFLIGLAISAYGLTQAILAIPMGMLSDRFGRKRIISIGLILFAIGSVIAALADSIQLVIIGRAIQGSGAIASVVMALAADLTREEHRTKAMAIMGVSIGISFLIAMGSGPILAHWIGVPGIFWLTAILALGGIAVLYGVVPKATLRFHRDTEPVPAQFKAMLGNADLLRLDFGILALHLILTAGFVVIPLALRDAAGLDGSHHGWIYLPVMLAAIGSMVPFVILAEKKRKMKPVFLGAILTIVLADLGLAYCHDQLWPIIACLYVYFTGFNLLEATLPSLISKTAPADLKGTAMGIYSTSQFLGAFLGGMAGGWIYGQFGMTQVFLFCVVVALAWLLVAFSMNSPRYLSSLLLNIGTLDEQRAHGVSQQLLAIPGVAEAVVLGSEGVAYLKIDKEKLDQAQLQRFVDTL